MVHDPKLLQAVLTQAAPLDMALAFRPMFGGIMAYADGKVFASLSDVGLALKLSGDARAALLETPGARALQYEPDQPPSKSYVVVPDAMLESPGELTPWIVRCTAALTPTRKRAKSKEA